jgi:hypothetical protein
MRIQNFIFQRFRLCHLNYEQKKRFYLNIDIKSILFEFVTKLMRFNN